MKNISAIVLTKNEEQMLPDCLKSLHFCDEIIVIDSQSTDKTVEIAKKHGAHVFVDVSDDFSKKRTLGLQKATSQWILYVDADERVTDVLHEEIMHVVTGERGEFSAFALRRKNFYLGNHEWPGYERMERLFRKDRLKGWTGALHESPEIEGEVGDLSGYLLHYTHRELSEMVKKTNRWSETEAKLRYEAHHPLMKWWRFPRVMLQAFSDSYIKQQGFRAGTAGLIESMYQSFSIFITYAKLWEMQEEKRK